MSKILSNCPVCGDELKITKLQCTSCGLELANNFELSPFDKLDNDRQQFLLVFLKHRGNLKSVQDELNISYPYAAKKLTDLLDALGLIEEEMPIMNHEAANPQAEYAASGKASALIKHKLAGNGGRVTVSSVTGKHYVITAGSDGQHFFCDDLPPVFTYDVFDVVVDLLKTQPAGKAKKGNARFHKLGAPGCTENTVAGAILKKYFGKSYGESGLDPVFILAAVLEWAGIAINGRGYLQLTASFRDRF